MRRINYFNSDQSIYLPTFVFQSIPIHMIKSIEWFNQYKSILEYKYIFQYLSINTKFTLKFSNKTIQLLLSNKLIQSISFNNLCFPPKINQYSIRYCRKIFLNQYQSIFGIFSIDSISINIIDIEIID